MAIARSMLTDRQRFSHADATRSHAVVQAERLLEAPALDSERHYLPSAGLRPDPWPLAAQTGEPFQDKPPVCKDEILGSQSCHAHAGVSGLAIGAAIHRLAGLFRTSGR